MDDKQKKPFGPSAFIVIKMSCNTSSNKAAGAATRNGITASTSKKIFSLAMAAAGVLLSGLLLSHRFSRQQHGSAPSSLPGPERVKSLAAPERIEPMMADKLQVQRCAWYNLGGRVYCQECAPGQANKAGVTLARPAASRTETAVKYPQTGRRTALKPRLVKVGPVDNLEGYAVWAGNKDTGLTPILFK